MPESFSAPDRLNLINRLSQVLDAESRFSALSHQAKRTALETLVLTLEERMKVETPEQPAAAPSSA